ncbi:MAG: hypothetical protein K6A69_00455 [Lachnospiraceae bacterium]|nr:hypothetical protein [Lachnospiraceae bacterium]
MASIKKICKERANKLYGGKFPQLVEKRLEKELDLIKETGTSALFETAYEMKKLASKNETLIFFRNAFGAPLVSYLLGVVNLNPLPGHYYCHKCDYAEFPVVDDDYTWCGPDLPDKKCPICGEPLRKDGYSFHEKLYPEMGKDADHQIVLECTRTLVKECIPDSFTELSEEEAIERKFYVPHIKPKEPRERAAFELERRMLKTNGARKERMDRKYFHVMDDDMDVRVTCIMNPNLEFLEALENSTHVRSRDVFFDDKKTFALFNSVQLLGVPRDSIGFDIGTLGVPAYSSNATVQLLKMVKPTRFSHLIQCMGLIMGSGTWTDNADKLMKEDGISLSDVITSRDDIFVALTAHNIDEKRAVAIAKAIGTGMGMGHDVERVMEAMDVPEWYVESCRKIKYLFPKTYIVFHNAVAWQIAWYKRCYPREFYKCFIDEFADSELKRQIAAGANVVAELLDKYNPDVMDDLGKEMLVEYPVLMVANEMYVRGYQYSL